MPVSLVSGFVELTDPTYPKRPKTKVAFTDVMVAGNTLDEIRANFAYHKAFRWKDREPIRKLERKGCVRLLSLEVSRRIGLEPTPRDVSEEYI